MEEELGTMQKALFINLDEKKYGTFAEIGAGQEVARNFFQAGGAAGTIAKSMSAYDMAVSDAIYGTEETSRYVCRSRVQKMLNREYPLLVDRVSGLRSKASQYFAFANTVAAKGYKSKKDCHGWMGIQLQLYPGAEPSEILLHVRMHDNSNTRQQEALGILGVNLVYGAFCHFNEPKKMLKSLMDNLTWERIEIDYCHFNGPYFEDVDNRKMALYLVQAELTSAVMLNSDGEIVLSSETLYKKNILVARGAFRPVTMVNVDMSNCAKEEFLKEKGVTEENSIFLAEMTLAGATEEIDLDDYLERANQLAELGVNIIISNYLRFFTLRAYLNRQSKKKLGIVLSVPNIIDIFNEQFYEGMEGGILEAFGKLFASGTRLFVYPRMHIDTGELITTESLKVPEHLKYLYRHLLVNGYIVPLEGGDPAVMGIHSQNVLRDIQFGEGDWKSLVPESVYESIKTKKLFGFDSE
jgi:hypothetical protein